MLHGTVFMLLNEQFCCIFRLRFAKEEDPQKHLDLAAIKKDITSAPFNRCGVVGVFKVGVYLN